MTIVILNHSEVTALLPISKCIAVMSEALQSLARGGIEMPLRMVVSPPGARGILSLMPAYRSGAGTGYGVKGLTVFPQNSAIGKESHQGSVQLFDGEHGELLAIMNASAITAVRTAAVSALATKVLARADGNDLAIIGAGVQGRTHLAAIAEVKAIRRVRVADLMLGRARSFASEVSSRYSFPVEAVDSVEAAVTNADIIVTVTSSREPVLRRAWISEGAHINAIGACTPNARELDTAIVATAKLYVDSRESILSESGDFLQAAQEGAIGPQHIQAELGELLTGKAAGRASDREITLFKGLGLAAEDLAAAEYLYREARDRHAGTWLEF